MKKKTKWQLPLIITVLVLTLYNILPTLLFYTKPLNEPITTEGSKEIIHSMMKRVNSLEDEAISWIHSFNKLIGVDAKSVQIVRKSPRLVKVEFTNSQNAETFRKLLPRSGSLIPFFPASLSISEEILRDESLEEQAANVVYVQRMIPIHFHTFEADKFFRFAKIREADKTLSSQYWPILEDRIITLAFAVAGGSENSALVELAIKNENPSADDFLYYISQNIILLDKTLGNYPQIAKQFYATFTNGLADPKGAIEKLIEKTDEYKALLQKSKIELKEKKSADPATLQEIISLETKEAKILHALTILKKNKLAFISETPAWTRDSLRNLLNNALSPSQLNIQELKVSNNPVIDKIFLNISDSTLSLAIRPDIIALKESLEKEPSEQSKYSALNQLIYDEIAKISRESGETLMPGLNEFSFKFSTLANADSFITLNLTSVAKAEYAHVKQILQDFWNPTSEDLKRSSYPIQDWVDFQKNPASQKNLSLVLYAPSLSNTPLSPGFKANSIYVIAKDLGKIIKKFSQDKPSEEASKVRNDFEELSRLLKAQGFNGYPGTTYPLSSEFADDYIFEVSDFYLPLLMATRENFSVAGTKKFAVLELSNVRERILTLNQIETKNHEDLLKWQDEYNQCKVDPTLRTRFDVPKPTRNVLWDNFVLSFKKYFRGDERKIIQWGLDLSGGKTVQIALTDSSNKPVTKENDLKQAINELFARVNKMGVSDVSIRQEGSNITLDFPGSQNISANELVKASSMTFNILNEKFATDTNSPLSSEVNRFLQEVWNEAIVTNKKDIESLNRIAFSHLYGDSFDEEKSTPKTETAKTLFDQGLRLANPLNPDISGNFDDTLSKIALYRGDSFAEWNGQTHPLLIVFKNFALEGSNLENVHSGYDPSKGNFLSFGVKNSQLLSDGKKIHPRNNLYSWTSLFAKDKLMGTPYEAATKGRGWRMSVILNGYVVSSPNLESALRESGMITGHFSQREINTLVSDLQAGSLTFTPQILSEKTVSPDLGLTERTQGITATIVALFAVIAVMVGYYRFGGLVASIAVLVNLLIMWATLQNIGASITLAGLAGIILTVGMAVDANVLVFERIREEFAKTKKLSTAIQAGYKRAFSAIIDSNITTVIAALILLNFDSGPIKGFAVTLIIGIISSMFTALFMTKYFFTEWVKNPKRKELKMANLIQGKNWNFLKYGKISIILSLLLITIGGFTLLKERSTIMGMDFTGGFAANVEFKGAQATTELITKAFLKEPNVSSQDFQVREYGTSNQFRISLSKTLTLPGKPFYEMPIENELEFPTYSYEKNPKLVWLVQTLEKGGLEFSSNSLEKLDQNWKSISGQMSDTMRNNAIIGLALACLCILLYITFRFEFAYAISSTLGLVFDILITLSVLALLHLAGANIQIDLNTVAALMTIIGYSLNDTIIVFDRIREELGQRRSLSFKEIVNYSLNATLSRTLLTSGTTLLVLICLVAFGGKTLFSFSLIMAIGVIVGTLSTFFIASTLLLFFHHKEKKSGHRHDNGNLSTNGASH
jgi:SecD/SecF fusion protein